MAALVLLALLCPPYPASSCGLSAPAAGFDVDGDGVADRVGVAMTDADNDGSFDRPGAAILSGAPSDSVHFSLVWTSGSILNNQWDAHCGYLDGDSLLDLLGHHWNPNVLHVFEADRT
ncbi:hypothetical protein FJY71_08550, partial [candidate division WOR-3 bacterium]|nr:hypothetical protein [candidate division WOR-3 bacterium]